MSLIANTFRVALCGGLTATVQAAELPWCMLPTPDWVVLAYENEGKQPQGVKQMVETLYETGFKPNVGLVGKKKKVSQDKYDFDVYGRLVRRSRAGDQPDQFNYDTLGRLTTYLNRPVTYQDDYHYTINGGDQLDSEAVTVTQLNDGMWQKTSITTAVYDPSRRYKVGEREITMYGRDCQLQTRQWEMTPGPGGGPLQIETATGRYALNRRLKMRSAWLRTPLSDGNWKQSTFTEVFIDGQWQRWAAMPSLVKEYTPQGEIRSEHQLDQQGQVNLRQIYAFLPDSRGNNMRKILVKEYDERKDGSFGAMVWERKYIYY
ncbi:hypothetical protein [Aquitalea denitrificans]|uniref:hypothetical protein n=1 Tax=Aquitalea denitrificans TaxID=519081 RepID=UPI00135C040D|nr:hypothetical protein [Aquitalea denitrificans]